MTFLIRTDDSLQARPGQPIVFGSACLLLAVLFLLLTAGAWADDYADRTPGQEYLQKGLRAYDNGQYNIAQRDFLSAARWSDKLAQYNLGAMHYHGHGFDRDPARAWAWFKVAAERDYPLFVDTADRVWDALDQSQRERATAIHEGELLSRYGDAVAVPRTVRYMRREQRKATGSRVGWGGGFLEVYELGGGAWIDPSSGRVFAPNGRRYQGDQYYDPDRWDYERILRMEAYLFDAEAQGEVTLGDFQIIEDDEDSPDGN